MRSRLDRTLLLVALLALPATGEAAMTTNRLASNRLASNRLASNRLASNRLASNRLASNGVGSVQLAATELLATADGREVLSYLVGCALEPDVTLDAEVDGQEYQFAGDLGLAPRWTRRRLSGKEKRWVSACMLARVNAFATAEAISLRGPHPNLTVSQDESELFTVAEGAFYGDIFRREGDPMIQIACQGEGQAAGEIGGLGLRDCTEPDPANPGLTMCGFTFAGDCADYSPQFPTPYACNDTSAGYYAQCRERPGLGVWRRLKNYKEVISVFVSAD